MAPDTGRSPQELRARARGVRLLVMDVDGVLTDGGMYYGEHGEELKKFNTRDGQGIALLRDAGLETAILTKENTPIVTRRAAKLRIDEVRVGVEDKLAVLAEILEARKLTFEQVAYIGDDLNDYEVLCRVGLAVVVQDATPKPRSVAHYITRARGGEGAVRELCELLLEWQAEAVQEGSRFAPATGQLERRYGDSMLADYYRGRRVLVTGANGFIGAWLSASLIGLGSEVTGFDMAEGGALSLHSGLRGRIRLVLGQTTDQNLVRDTLVEDRIQTVFHLAANSNLGWARSNPVPVFESNIQGAWSVLEACRQVWKGSVTPQPGDEVGGREAESRSIVVASSNTVYGEQTTREPFSEDFPFNPAHPYPASKACTDIIARCYAGQFGLPIAVVRATNTFGGADPNLKRIVPDTCLKLLRGERPVILSDGSPEKGYLFVKDTVRAYLMVGARTNDEYVRGQAFNFHPPRPTTVLDLVRAMVKVSGQSGLEPEVRGKPGSYEYEFLSAERAMRVLDWEPQYSLEAGLAETYAWYQEHAGLSLESAAGRFVAV